MTLEGLAVSDASSCSSSSSDEDESSEPSLGEAAASWKLPAGLLVLDWECCRGGGGEEEGRGLVSVRRRGEEE